MTVTSSLEETTTVLAAKAPRFGLENEEGDDSVVTIVAADEDEETTTLDPIIGVDGVKPTLLLLFPLKKPMQKSQL